MTPKIPENIRQALHQQQGKPLEVEDEQTRKLYVIVEKEEFRKMVDDQLRQQLQIGFDQADSGDVAEWDVEEVLGEAHRRHADRAS